MTNIILLASWSLLLAVNVAPASAIAQDVGTVNAMVRSATQVRSNQQFGIAARVIMQIDVAPSAFQIDAVADSVVAAASAPPEYPFALKMQAINVLMRSGMAGEGRVIYANAAMKLQRVAETASDVGVRAGAVSAISSLSDTRASTAALRSIATSANPAAHVAIEYLASTKTFPDGLATVHEMYVKKQVVEKEALRVLQFLAEGHGWDK